jgi:hypothetical protein
LNFRNPLKRSIVQSTDYAAKQKYFISSGYKIKEIIFNVKGPSINNQLNFIQRIIGSLNAIKQIPRH